MWFKPAEPVKLDQSLSIICTPVVVHSTICLTYATGRAWKVSSRSGATPGKTDTSCMIAAAWTADLLIIIIRSVESCTLSFKRLVTAVERFRNIFSDTVMFANKQHREAVDQRPKTLVQPVNATEFLGRLPATRELVHPIADSLNAVAD